MSLSCEKNCSTRSESNAVLAQGNTNKNLAGYGGSFQKVMRVVRVNMRDIATMSGWLAE